MTFRSDWSRAYGAALPLGYVLRVEFPAQWTRFHALTAAKRYATTDDEMADILSRANTLATSCFAENADIWLARCRIPGGPPAPAFARQYEHRDHAAESLVEVQADLFPWLPGAHDSVFRAIAEDVDRLLFFDPTTAVVLAPYDGGFDLIDPDSARAQARRRRFADWLSPRADGL